MTPRGPRFELGTLTQGLGRAKMGWDAFLTLNNAIDEVRKVANDVKFNGGSPGGGERSLGEKRGALERVAVGEVYGRLRNDLVLMQVFERETKSMGTLEVVSTDGGGVDLSKFVVRWKRKVWGQQLVDIQGKTCSLIHDLTADDVGTTIIVEIYPKEEASSTLNVTYAEFGPIEMDETTKTALSKSLKTGLIRFPVKILRDEFEGLPDPRDSPGGGRSTNCENSCMTRDILVVTSDEVKVIRNGMSSSSNSSFEKSTEWSAKYFGGNIHIVLSQSSTQELTLCSGYDVHKQRISIRTTSRNARDIVALTIRCLSTRHSVSLEAIIRGGVFWGTADSGVQSRQGEESVADEDRRLNILAYLGRLESELVDLDSGRERLSEDKKRLQTEKALLENELAETITAYQEIISQYQLENPPLSESCSRCSCNSSKKHLQEFSLDSAGLKNKHEYKPLRTAAVPSPPGSTGSSLLHGYSGAYPHPTGKSPPNQSSKTQISTEMKRMQDENNSLKLSIAQLNSKYEVGIGAKESMERMHAEIEELRGRLERSEREKEEFKQTSERLEREVFVKNQELEGARQSQSSSSERDLEKMQDRILDLQSQNSEKQQAIQTLSTEKSKLLRDFSSLKLDFERLREQHNQLSKRYVSLNLELSKGDCSVRTKTREKDTNESCSVVSGSRDGDDQKDELSVVKAELQDYKKANAELSQTVAQLKSRVRRLAMIHSS